MTTWTIVNGDGFYPLALAYLVGLHLVSSVFVRRILRI